MFRFRQQLRCWATRVLVVWLFGIGAGIANACLTPELSTPGGAAAVAAAGGSLVLPTTPASGGAHEHDPGQAPHDDAGPHEAGAPADANCLDLCGKASLSIASLKSALDDACGHAAALPAVLAVLPPASLEPPRRRSPRRIERSAPPIPIAFLRLAL